MRNIYKISMGLLVVGVLLLSAMAPMESTAVRAVDFNLDVTDAPNDVTGTNAVGDIASDTDILSLHTEVQGDIIEMQLSVAGIVHNSTGGSQISYGYIFYMDINMDGSWDWKLSCSANYYSTYPMVGMLGDDDGDHTYTISEDNITGNGTNTLTAKFPMSYITDEIVNWDVYCSTEGYDYTSSDYSSWKSAEDQAPDDGFTTDPDGDNDGDGMPNGWEGSHGLNPNDPSDASTDADGDGATNLEEYEGYTDPQDPDSHPPILNPEVQVAITKPTNGEVINGGSYSTSYTAEGTAHAPAGDTIDHVEWRIRSATRTTTDWQWASDTSDSGDWSTWEAAFSTYYAYGYGTVTSGVNYFEVKGITNGDYYNKANTSFTFKTDDGSSSGGGDTGGGSGGDTGGGSGGDTGGDTGGSYGSSPDPTTETATDTSIKVSIDTVTDSVDDNGNVANVDMTIKGSTSGVDHCKIAFVDYYSDGTHDTDVYWLGSFDDNEYMKAMGFTAYHFKSTSDHWKSWEYVVRGSINSSDWHEEEGNKTVIKTIIYVRAYSDAAETKWNQDSYTWIPGADSEEEDLLSSIPGFEAFALVAVFGVAMLIWRRDRI